MREEALWGEGGWDAGARLRGRCQRAERAFAHCQRVERAFAHCKRPAAERGGNRRLPMHWEDGVGVAGKRWAGAYHPCSAGSAVYTGQEMPLKRATGDGRMRK